MKLMVVVLAVGMTLSSSAFAQYGYGSNPNSHYSSGYTNRNGTYVQPHYSTNPNGTQRDNYGTSGNINPYNGHVGTRSPRW